MTNAAPANRSNVYAALMQKTGFEVLEESENPKKLRFCGRCKLDKWPFFAPVIHQLITTSKKPGNPWSIDISKQYIVHEGQVRYTWRFIFQAPDLTAQYQNIVSTIMAAAQPARVEVTRQLLPGYKEGDVRGGFNERGKGTGAAGSTPPTIAARAGGR